ncbi:MAG: ABC transporter substrate-binding protein [Deltaproteobacteria bacterium]|nr:ABC transporter substrate-binding protein [Deltaproteobacteria bacterium]
MDKIKSVFVTSFASLLFAILVIAAPPGYAKTLYVGGTMALTGAYAEDTAAVLAGYQDYVRYVNETKNLAPWRNEKFPPDVTLKLLWRDDELKPPKALSIYEELKAKGILVFRCSGSPQALALKDRLFEDGFGAPSMATGPYLLTPPQSVFTYYPIYTDSLAAVADWFMVNWKEKRKPRVAYLTADNAMGRSIVVPELTNYLKKIGYTFVGTQFVPLVPTSPPTTQLMWLKKRQVDLALGVMINPGSQPTVKEMVRLGMGPKQPYKIIFGVPAPGHTAVFAAAMGKLGDGYVCAGSFPPMDEISIPGIRFANDLQNKYHPNKRVTHIMYEAGIIEAMTQVEALRLAMQKVSFDKLTPRAVLENGFYQIKGLSTGGMTSTPLTYGKGDIEGVDRVRVDQVQNGKVVNLGTWPTRHLYKRK